MYLFGLELGVLLVTIGTVLIVSGSVKTFLAVRGNREPNLVALILLIVVGVPLIIAGMMLEPPRTFAPAPTPSISLS
jgi:uncharacterized membrane protein HdeD (DUF308 family)